MAGKINRAFFFDNVRHLLFRDKLSQKQTDGLNFILDVWEKNYAAKDDRWLAYALGTAHHEVAGTMQPINEFGGNKWYFDMYDKEGKRPQVAKRLGNTEKGDGVLFHGRGYVQLTGRANYVKMGKHFKTDLTSGKAAADKVLQPTMAAEIMFFGMETGAFTGKKFADYFSGAKADWVRARAIINGRDKAQPIANMALHYYSSISYTTG